MKDILAKQKVAEPSVNLGATYLGDNRCRFLVWAPLAEQVEVHLVSPREELVPLERGKGVTSPGWLRAWTPGCRYFYRLHGQQDFPDPASRFQPEGVHGPSQVVEPRFLLGRRPVVRPAPGRLRHLRTARGDFYPGRDL